MNISFTILMLLMMVFISCIISLSFPNKYEIYSKKGMDGYKYVIVIKRGFIYHKMMETMTDSYPDIKNKLEKIKSYDEIVQKNSQYKWEKVKE